MCWFVVDHSSNKEGAAFDNTLRVRTRMVWSDKSNICLKLGIRCYVQMSRIQLNFSPIISHQDDAIPSDDLSLASK